MTAIPFVDAHIHLWELARIPYPWLTPPFEDGGPNGSVEPIAQDYLPADYARDAARWNVVGAVHVEAGADAADALEETIWLNELTDQTRLPSAMVAFAALDRPDVEECLEEQASHDRVRGIRQIVNWHADPQRSYALRDLTVDPKWQSAFGLLAAHSLSFDLQCYPTQMPQLARLFARHDETQVVINHLGMPVLTDPQGLEQWRTGLGALAALPSVAIKISGLGFIERNWTEDLVRPLVLETIEMFGVERCLFASDFPTDKLFGSFDRHLETYHAIVADFSEDERRALFGRNADRVYRLGLQSEGIC